MDCLPAGFVAASRKLALANPLAILPLFLNRHLAVEFSVSQCV